MYDDETNEVNGGCFWLVVFALFGAIIVILKVISNVWKGE